MSASTPTDPSSGEDSVQPRPDWWKTEPPASTGPADDEYDASLDAEPDEDYYSQADLDYFADREADRYERWLFRD